MIQPNIEETTMTTNSIITSDNLIRATGPFAILAGLIFAGIQPIHPPDFVASVTTMQWMVIITAKFLMCLFFLIGTAGLYFRQMSKAGWLGLVAFVLFAAAWWLQTGYVFTELLVLPPLASISPDLVDSFLSIANQHPATLDIGQFGTVYGILGLLYLVGGILLGVATLRAGVLPRIPSVLLAAAALITPAAALLPHEFQRYAAIPMGIAFIWLGLALWFPAKRTDAASATLHPAPAA
jgi:hypothetical protein